MFMDVLRKGEIHSDFITLFNANKGMLNISFQQLKWANTIWSNHYSYFGFEENFFEMEIRGFDLIDTSGESKKLFRQEYQTMPEHKFNAMLKQFDTQLRLMKSKMKNKMKEMKDELPPMGTVDHQQFMEHQKKQKEAKDKTDEVTTHVITVIDALASNLEPTKTKTSVLSKNLRLLLNAWGKGGYSNSKKHISILDNDGFFTNRAAIMKIQDFIVHGKTKLVRNIRELFVPQGTKFVDGEWEEYVQYGGKNSKDIILEVFDYLSIPIKTGKDVRQTTKIMQEYFTLDIEKFSEKILSLIEKEKMKILTARNKQMYQFLFKKSQLSANVNMISRMSNHIMNLYEDGREKKLSHQESDDLTDEINEHMRVLEFMYSVLRLTGNETTVIDKEIAEIESLRGKLRGRIVTIKFDKHKEFPMLSRAYGQGAVKEGTISEEDIIEIKQELVQDLRRHLKSGKDLTEAEKKEIQEQIDLVESKVTEKQHPLKQQLTQVITNLENEARLVIEDADLKDAIENRIEYVKKLIDNLSPPTIKDKGSGKPKEKQRLHFSPTTRRRQEQKIPPRE